MKLKFTKMQGCGNDFIIFDCFKQNVENPGELSVRLSNRNFGIGADGIVLILPPDDIDPGADAGGGVNADNAARADARMRIYNADGSEAMMCGNATRCIGKFLFERGYVKSPSARLQTNSGIKTLAFAPDARGMVRSVRVDMGPASLDPASLPAIIDGERVVGREVALECGTHKITLVSMGNPHCVIFTSPERVTELGPKIERDRMFPERVNVEFAEVTGENALRMRVWERGSGETLACGTGACATAVAAVENGLCDRLKPITVSLRGGDLTILYKPGAVYMTGPAETVFEGEVEV